MIPLATVIVDVLAAMSVRATMVSRNGNVGEMPKPSGCGDGRARCSPVHTDSKPAASACRATRTATSGSAHVP